MDRLNCDLEGYTAFLVHVRSETNRWWTRKWLAHWIPRVRFSLWLFRNLPLITRCVAEQVEAEIAIAKAMERR